MPRIRTIKPEFWTDAKIMEISMPARLLFLGLISHADDHGNQEASIPQTKARIFPADSIDIESCIIELQTRRLLVEYSSNGRQYWNIVNFRKHQKIDRPSRGKFPPPPKDTLVEDSSIPRDPSLLDQGSRIKEGIKDLPHVEDSSRVESSTAEVKVSRPKDPCSIESCKRRGTVREAGRWYCSQHSPDQPAQPEQVLNLAGLLTDAEKFLRS